MLRVAAAASVFVCVCGVYLEIQMEIVEAWVMQHRRSVGLNLSLALYDCSLSSARLHSGTRTTKLCFNLKYR